MKSQPTCARCGADRPKAPARQTSPLCQPCAVRLAALRRLQNLNRGPALSFKDRCAALAAKLRKISARARTA